MSNATTMSYSSEAVATLTNRASWWCFVIPYCNTTGCNTSEVSSPVQCPNCSAAVVALLMVILVVMSVFIVLANTGIILVIVKNPIFHNPFNVFKCSLAVADLLVGVLVMPYGVYEMVVILLSPYEEHEKNMSEVYLVAFDGKIITRGSVCARIHREEQTATGLFMSIIGVLSIMASIFNLVLLSADRFLAVSCPIKYVQRRAINNRTAAFLIFIVWVVSAILTVVVPLTMGTDYFRHGLTPPMIFTLETMDSFTGFFYALFAIGVPYVALVGLNAGTGILLFKKRTKILKKTSTLPKNPASSNNSTRRSNETKAAVTLFVMVLVFTVSTIPALIFVMLYNDQKNDGLYTEGHSVGNSYMVLVLLLVSNSAWNFIIYSWRNDNFRKALRNLVCGASKKLGKVRWKKVTMVALGRRHKKRRRAQFSKSSTRDSDDKQTYSSAFL